MVLVFRCVCWSVSVTRKSLFSSFLLFLSLLFIFYHLCVCFFLQSYSTTSVSVGLFSLARFLYLEFVGFFVPWSLSHGTCSPFSVGLCMNFWGSKSLSLSGFSLVFLLYSFFVISQRYGPPFVLWAILILFRVLSSCSLVSMCLLDSSRFSCFIFL